MELLDVLDEDGNVIGVEDRSVVHEKGCRSMDYE